MKPWMCRGPIDGHVLQLLSHHIVHGEVWGVWDGHGQGMTGCQSPTLKKKPLVNSQVAIENGDL